MHWPSIRGLAAMAAVRLRAKETEICAAPYGPLRLGKNYTFLLTYLVTYTVSTTAPDGENMSNATATSILPSLKNNADKLINC